MKFASCVVLYNPDETFYANIESYKNESDIVYVIDNSDNGFCLSDEFLAESGTVKVISFHGNKGIATALNTACKIALQDQVDYLMTMDQDSSLNKGNITRIKDYINTHDMSDIGLLCQNTTEFKKDDDSNTPIEEIKTMITSGNIIVMDNYRKIKGFDEKLFIDQVDFDLDYQFYKANLKLILLKDIYINHKIGNQISKNIFGKKVISSNHSAIRYYYIYRNDYYLYHKDKDFFRAIHKNYLKDILRMLLVEKNKCKKLKMIKSGIKDAKHNKFGKYNETSYYL